MVFGFCHFWIMITPQYQQQSLLWNPRAWERGLSQNGIKENGVGSMREFYLFEEGKGLMWLNVIQANLMWNKTAGQQSPSQWFQGGLWICTGAPGFYSLAFDVKSVCVFFAAGQCSWNFSPSPPIPLWLEDKYVVSILCFHCFFQCESAWQLRLTGLSWIPYMQGLVCSQVPPSFQKPFTKLFVCWWVNHDIKCVVHSAVVFFTQQNPLLDYTFYFV